MRFFKYLSKNTEENVFHVVPGYFDRDSDIEILSYALGATLYTPASKGNLVKNILTNKYNDLMSTVLCLEDSIGDNEIHESEYMLIEQLKYLNKIIKNGEVYYQDIPLIFVRIRNAEHLYKIWDMMGENINLITGFVLPKFNHINGDNYFEILRDINNNSKKKIYAMPIFESSEIIYKELRYNALIEIDKILMKNEDFVLNIRIGAADFCRLFGIRRSCDLSIYDIAVVRDCISDIVNFFNRCDRNFVISGPVWEYFESFKTDKEVDKFITKIENDKYLNRYKLDCMDKYTKGLIKETKLDKANGLIGKTVIHPNQIKPVQSIYVVQYEEYLDAQSIISSDNGDVGVVKSDYSNKMNEIKTHLIWAKNIMKRSKIYGVYNDKQKRENLLA